MLNFLTIRKLQQHPSKILSRGFERTSYIYYTYVNIKNHKTTMVDSIIDLHGETMQKLRLLTGLTHDTFMCSRRQVAQRKRIWISGPMSSAKYRCKPLGKPCDHPCSGTCKHPGTTTSSGAELLILPQCRYGPGP